MKKNIVVPVESPSPLQQAISKVEGLIDELVTASLLLKLQTEKPNVISEDMGNVLKIGEAKRLEAGALMDGYSKSLADLVSKEYPELKNILGLALTALVSNLLFPKEANESRNSE
ncbi:MAG TPA: hypothetical protein VLH94_04155 [Spirochaetia bacterium]|nr:hypothetical protein [Spirochaetia bacterium]